MSNWNLQITVLPSVSLILATFVVCSTDAVAGDDICRDAGLTGKGFGLCTAYCEAMDCDSENPNANDTACTEVQTKFLAETGLSSLPCGDGTGEPPLPDLECPCGFDAEEVRASLSDQLTYPFVACIRQRNIRSVGTARSRRARR